MANSNFEVRRHQDDEAISVNNAVSAHEDRLDASTRIQSRLYMCSNKQVRKAIRCSCLTYTRGSIS